MPRKPVAQMFRSLFAADDAQLQKWIAILEAEYFEITVDRNAIVFRTRAQMKLGARIIKNY